VAIRGTEKIMPPGTIAPHTRADVTVRFGQPLRFGSEEGYAAGTARVETTLRNLLQEASP
jgi:long-chain acyl-CoA synthetase